MKNILVVKQVRFWPIALLTLVTLLTSIKARASEECWESSRLLDENNSRLRELHTLQDDLNTQFAEAVEANVTEISEGIFSEITINTAKKAAYARRSLVDKIAQARGAVLVQKTSFCGQCSPVLDPEEGIRDRYCDQCLGKPHCE